MNRTGTPPVDCFEEIQEIQVLHHHHRHQVSPGKFQLLKFKEQDSVYR